MTPILRCVSLLFLLTGCSRATSITPELARVAQFRPIYDGTVSIDPGARRLTARWHIEFVRTEAMRDSATLRLNRGFRITALSGIGIASFADREQDGDMVITLRFASPAATSPATIDVAYDGSPVFGTDTINGIDGKWVELGLDSYWLPVFSDYAHLITGQVRMRLPSGWKLATSGDVRLEGDTYSITQRVPLIDIPLSASPALASVARGRVRVHFVGAQPAVVPTVLDIATACVSWLDTRYGAHDPLPAINMVFAPRGGPGYARKNYIMISNAADTSTVQLERFICHELAHYWSSGAIASGPENWLNEAFAEFVSGRYIRSTARDATYRDVVLKRWQDNSSNAGPVWTPSSTRRPTARASYNKAPALLHQLEERIGTPAMDTFLTRFMTESVRTTAGLLALLTQVAGAETSAWFSEQLAVR